MIFRRLLATLVALVMAVAPLGMPAMAAATPASHHGETVGQEHCDQQPQPDRQQRSADKSCCAAMCIAVMFPSSVAQFSAHHPNPERPASDLGRHGFLGEVATPPPRRA